MKPMPTENGVVSFSVWHPPTCSCCQKELRDERCKNCGKQLFSLFSVEKEDFYCSAYGHMCSKECDKEYFMKVIEDV